MSNTDWYLTLAIGAWLVGAYMIMDGLRELTAAQDRQSMATYCATEAARAYFRDDWERLCSTAAERQTLLLRDSR